MTIYGITGLGADERIFQFLNLSKRIEPIVWIKPYPEESIKSYSLRLSAQINADEFVLIAVSFGGLIAVELNKILKPKFTILISSAETRNGLRTIYRLAGKGGVLGLFPSFLFNPPPDLMCWLFGAKNKKLLKEILADTDIGFAKWAIIQLTRWQNKESFDNLVKIHGTKDKLLRYKQNNQTIPVKNGTHFMIVDRAEEISRIIEKALRTKT